MRIGLTGGIGSGKSTVLQMLAELGAATIDADAISRAVTAPGGAAMPQIEREFGPSFIAADGGMDRAAMRALAYADPTARHRLEGIVHPHVGQENKRQVQMALAAGKKVLVFDIPLLVESGRWRAQVERVLVIDCEPQTQIARVMQRNGLPEAQVKAIMAAQASRRQRLAAADLVICNEAIPLETLRSEVALAAHAFGL